MTDRELSEKVAILLGWKKYESWLNPNSQWGATDPSYATNIAACFRDVVPKMRAFSLCVDINGVLWAAAWLEVSDQGFVWVDADTPARAICEAFVQMMEREKDDDAE